jgi:hypothetical protein
VLSAVYFYIQRDNEDQVDSVWDVAEMFAGKLVILMELFFLASFNLQVSAWVVPLKATLLLPFKSHHCHLPFICNA